MKVYVRLTCHALTLVCLTETEKLAALTVV